MSHNENFAEKNSQQENDQPQEEIQSEEELSYDSFSETLDPAPDQAAQPSEGTGHDVSISLLEEELARTKDQMLRAVAEAENGRKRALKEREDASKYAISGFSRDLLSVADNLRRALEAIPGDMLQESEQMKNLTDGILATERELLRCFEKNGIEKTDPIYEPFDPNFHEVMFEAPMPDKENGIVIQVIEPGYTLNGRLLRPARVGVAKNDAEASDSGPTEPGQTINTEV